MISKPCILQYKSYSVRWKKSPTKLIYYLPKQPDINSADKGRFVIILTNTFNLFECLVAYLVVL